ncbi:heat shock protein 81-1-like [Iris pallida]|uniref:Heat shock protein 81-1-like n=1 Tax=Iris pallida TaxID=29817 RepID=A0AAX6H2J5_IRIPA|nr:heat shock protein 81-1-like [Iris pallida]
MTMSSTFGNHRLVGPSRSQEILGRVLVGVLRLPFTSRKTG